VRGRLRNESSTLAWLGLALMLAVSVPALLHLTRDTTLWFDEWVWALDRRGSSLGTYLEPHNGHFSLLPIALYKLLFATAGLDHYLPYRVMIIAAHLLVVALVFVYARRRDGGLAALVPAALLLTLGPAWQNFLWPFQVGWLLSLAAGVGALLLLDRGDRRGDAGACVLLAVALASSGLGLPIAAGLLVEVMWGRRAWRQLWIVAAPLALYAIWWVVYQDTGIVRDNVFVVPAFAADGAAGALGALTGQSSVRTDANGVINDAGSTLAWGRPLAVLAAGLVAWRLATMGPVPARLLSLLTVPVSFWLLTGLQRAHIGSADSSRYLYVGALFVLLLAVELLRGVAVPRWAAAVALGVAAVAVVGNLGHLRTGAEFLRLQAPPARGDLAALEIARPSVPPGYVAQAFPGTPLISVPAADYFAAADALGTPAYTPSGLATAPEPARSTADRELSAVYELAVRREDAATAGRAPAVETASGGTAQTRGACVRFRPGGGSGRSLQLTVPPGGVLLKAVGGPAKVSVRRFAATFPAEPLTTLTSPGVLRIARDRAPQPWHLQLAPQAGAEACSLG
jgi:hypothetical protein